MARLSVLGLLVAGALVSACVTVTPVATPSTVITAAPSVLVTAAPTVTPEPTQPPATPEPTQPPTPTPTATPTEEPERTLAPGETPGATPMDVSAFLTATLNLVNLTDFETVVNVDIYSEGKNQGSVAVINLEALGSMFQSVLPGDYGVTFDPEGQAVTCLLTVAKGQQIDFTLVGDDILISDPVVPPTAPEDLFVGTSSLCER